MDINIKTTLGINPRHKPRELLVVTRGASFIYHYTLPEEISYNLLEQLTFTFKQKRQLYWYKMFRYLVLTEDTEVDESKVYYTNVVPVDPGYSNECTGTIVTNPMENPKEAHYYEEVLEPEEGLNDLYYILDKHFSYQRDTNTVTFIWLSPETSRLAPTARSSELKFEIAVRVDTDDEHDLAYHDSVIVYPQPDLIVKDSLYGQVSADSNTVSNSPERLASTGRNVRG